MAILNYTTKIDAYKTIGEIQKILSKHGAKRIMIENNTETGDPIGLGFQVDWNEKEHAFLLPCNFLGVLNAMKKAKVPNALCNENQALRVGWRILKDWVEAQMALKEADIASLPEIFLPYIVTKTGQTLFQRMNSEDTKLIN